MKKFQQGFVQIVVIAVIALLLLGGGAYVVLNDKEEDETATTTDEKIDLNEEGNDVNSDSEIGVEVKTLRSLLAIGRDVKCSFKGEEADYKTEGEVFVSKAGEVSGSFKTNLKSSGGVVESKVLVKGDDIYTWSGDQGIKISRMEAEVGGSAFDSSVNLDTEVNYNCSDWEKDESKFIVPKNVKFFDLNDLMKGGVEGQVDIESFINR